MPLFFGYSNTPILKEYKKKEDKKKEDKKKAEEAAGEVINHLELCGLKKTYVLKPYLDTYYKCNNSWKSNFCFLYKECNYSPSKLLNMLMDNTKTQYRKYRKGLLSEIQKRIENGRYKYYLSKFNKEKVPKYKGRGLSEDDRKLLTDDKNRCGGLGQKLAWLAICKAANKITGGYLQGDYNLIYTLWSEGLTTFQEGYYENIAAQMTEFHTEVDQKDTNKLNKLKEDLKTVPNLYDIIYEMFRNADDSDVRNTVTNSYNNLAKERLVQRKDMHPIGRTNNNLVDSENTIIIKFIYEWYFSTIERNYICKQFMKLKKGGFADFLVDILKTVNDTLPLHTNRNLQNKNKKKG